MQLHTSRNNKQVKRPSMALFKFLYKCVNLFYLLIVNFKNKISPGHTLLLANGTRGMHIHVTEYICIQIHMFLFPLWFHNIKPEIVKTPVAARSRKILPKSHKPMLNTNTKLK